MVDKRSLRSNKSDSASSANGSETSSGSSSQDSTSASRGKAQAATGLPKKGAPPTKKSASIKDEMVHRTNGTGPTENGVNGNGETKDIEMKEDEDSNLSVIDKAKKALKETVDEVKTVVVPPSKTSKAAGDKKKDSEGDVAMDADEEDTEPEEQVDPVEQAIQSKSSTSSLKLKISLKTNLINAPLSRPLQACSSSLKYSWLIKCLYSYQRKPRTPHTRCNSV
jgi:26S proteasome regulatory subunit N3